jgi:hypothetical protein
MKRLEGKIAVIAGIVRAAAGHGGQENLPSVLFFPDANRRRGRI